MLVTNFPTDYDRYVNLLLGKAFKTQRSLLSLSLEEISEKVDMDLRAIEAFESGIIPISASSLYALCGLMNMDLDGFYAYALEELTSANTLPL